MRNHPRRVYVFRRILAILLLGFLASVAIGVYQDVTTPAYTCSEKAVFAAPGDTIWSLLEQNCEGDLTAGRHFVVGLYGTRIYQGQLILLED